MIPSTSTFARDPDALRAAAAYWTEQAFALRPGQRIVASTLQPVGPIACAMLSAMLRREASFLEAAVTGAGCTAETGEVGATASPGATRRLPPPVDATGSPRGPGGAPPTAKKLRRRASRA